MHDAQNATNQQPRWAVAQSNEPINLLIMFTQNIDVQNKLRILMQKILQLHTFGQNPEQPDLNFRCTCPYGSGCKHAIAVVLTYVDSIKKRKKIPEVAPTDSRLKRIKEGPRRDDLEDDFEEAEDRTEKSTTSDPSKDVTEFLAKHSKDAEHHIAQTNPSAYVTAVGYLKEAQKTYIEIKRTNDLSLFIGQLRVTNK